MSTPTARRRCLHVPTIDHVRNKDTNCIECAKDAMLRKTRAVVKSDEFLRLLVADLATRPVSITKAVTIALAISAMVSLIGLCVGLGIRPDLRAAIGDASFWLKAAYTFLIGTAGLFALERSGRPGADATRYFVFVGCLAILFVLAAIAEVTILPAADASRAWLGSSWRICPGLIVLEAIPLLVAGFAILRHMAPTHQGSAAAAAGLMAGGYGGFLYSLHCSESTLAFLSTWYTLGIAFVVVIAFAARRFLRW